jgi:hypothetical protein
MPHVLPPSGNSSRVPLSIDAPQQFETMFMPFSPPLLYEPIPFGSCVPRFCFRILEAGCEDHRRTSSGKIFRASCKRRSCGFTFFVDDIGLLTTFLEVPSDADHFEILMFV